MTTEHAPVPVTVQLLLQPPNVEPAAGVAVSVTVLLRWKSAVHVAPQEIPAGELVTVPEPVPAFATVSCGRATVTAAPLPVTVPTEIRTPSWVTQEPACGIVQM